MKKILIFVFALSVLLPTLTFASFDTSLKYGSRGDAVIELQNFLKNQGVFSDKVDGSFGLITRKAVISFQLANGLAGDGYFGLSSRAKASSILAVEIQPSLVAGCNSTSAYSASTGQPCSSTSQPSITNLPAGCSSTSGFSPTTGQACNGATPPISSTNTQQDSTLKIAQCEAKRDADYNQFVAKANAMIEQGIEALKSEDQTAINNTPSPASLGSFEAYQINVKNIKTYYDSLIEQLKEKTAPLLDQEKAVTDSTYLKCISQ
jgi:peptidoglycan hydrolase-like protein with peptidoglycan-binding domain